MCDQNHYAVEKNLLVRTSSEIPLIAYWRDLWATATLESLILNREGRLEILVRYKLAYICLRLNFYNFEVNRKYKIFCGNFNSTLSWGDNAGVKELGGYEVFGDCLL